MAFEFNLMRSLIYVGLAKEEYRPKLEEWLYKYHVPESISKFTPYCIKYAFYQAYPTPPDGERFGVRKMQLTEHYWLVDEHLPEMANNIYNEYMPMDVLRWQGCIPDVNTAATHANAETGDAGRAVGGGDFPPFIFAFVPINWEEDFKGAGRTPEDRTTAGSSSFSIRTAWRRLTAKNGSMTKSFRSSRRMCSSTVLYPAK